MLFKLSNLNSNLALTLGYLIKPSFEQLGPGFFEIPLSTAVIGLNVSAANVKDI